MTPRTAASDVALLDRWSAQRDAEAFAELVRRHSAMVFGACQRVLRNAADAQDVAQECFVRLLESQPQSGRHSSVAGWLYVTATRRSLNRIRSDQRRLARDGQYAQGDPAASGGDPQDDIGAYVDEAIAYLPEKLREPLVLHFLEGQTHQAIATALNLPRTTVSSRIARGIDKVRAVLQRRGVALTASALASLLTAEAAQAAPAALTATLGKLALAHAPQTVAAASGSTLGLGTLIAVAAGLAVVVTGAILVSPILKRSSTNEVATSDTSQSTPAITASENPRPSVEVTASALPNEAPAPAAPVLPAASTGISITGKVLDSQGAPIPEVAVRLQEAGSGPPLAESLTDTTGAFTLANLKPQPLVFLSAHQEPLLHEPIDALELTEHGLTDLRITVYRPAAVEGIVVNAHNLSLPDMHVTDSWIPSVYSGTMNEETTDARGRFHITGLLPGKHKLVVLPTEDHRHELEDYRFEVAEGDTHSDVRIVYPGDEPFIAGRVTDEDGNPVHGVLVQCLYQDATPSVDTDDEGRYRLTRLPDDAQSFFVSRHGYIAQWPGNLPLNRDDVDFVLTRQAQSAVTGRVIDAATREPVTRFLVEGVRERRQYFTWGDFYRVKPVEDAEGRFVLGKVEGDSPMLIVRAAGYVPRFIPIDRAPDEPVEVLVELDASRVIAGLVVNASGEPVPETSLFVGSPPSINDWRQTYDAAAFKHELALTAAAQSAADGSFILDALPETTHTVLAFHPEQGWGTLALPMTERLQEDARIVLQSGDIVTGRITMAGEPVEDAYVGIYHLGLREHFQGYEAESDADGCFHAENVPEGDVRIQLSLGRGRGIRSAVSLHREATVTAGTETHVAIDLPRASAALSGTVSVHGDPAALGSVLLTHTDADGNTMLMRRELQGGRYTIHEAPVGDSRVTIRVFSEDSGHVTRTHYVTLAEEEEHVLDLDITGTGSVAGTLRGLGSFERSTVMLLAGDVAVPEYTPETYETLIDLIRGQGGWSPDGTFHLPGLDPGTYTLLGVATPLTNRGTDTADSRTITIPIQLEDGDHISHDVVFH